MNHCYHKLPTAVAKVAALGSAPGAKDFKVKDEHNTPEWCLDPGYHHHTSSYITHQIVIKHPKLPMSHHHTSYLTLIKSHHIISDPFTSWTPWHFWSSPCTFAEHPYWQGWLAWYLLVQPKLAHKGTGAAWPSSRLHPMIGQHLWETSRLQLFIGSFTSVFVIRASKIGHLPTSPNTFITVEFNLQMEKKFVEIPCSASNSNCHIWHIGRCIGMIGLEPRQDTQKLSNCMSLHGPVLTADIWSTPSRYLSYLSYLHPLKLTESSSNKLSTAISSTKGSFGFDILTVFPDLSTFQGPSGEKLLRFWQAYWVESCTILCSIYHFFQQRTSSWKKHLLKWHVYSYTANFDVSVSFSFRAVRMLLYYLQKWLSAKGTRRSLSPRSCLRDKSQISPSINRFCGKKTWALKDWCDDHDDPYVKLSKTYSEENVLSWDITFNYCIARKCWNLFHFCLCYV